MQIVFQKRFFCMNVTYSKRNSLDGNFTVCFSSFFMGLQTYLPYGCIHSSVVSASTIIQKYTSIDSEILNKMRDVYLHQPTYMTNI